MKRFKDSISFGLLLNLIIPGAGHIYLREYLFGLFIFTVMLIAAVLFLFSFIVALPLSATMFLFGLPGVFYLFTFVDLWRSARRTDERRPRTAIVAGFFLAVTALIALLAPLSPVNFFGRNLPEIVTVENDELSPLVKTGDVCWVSRLAYRANLFFVDQPSLHTSPERWQMVRFVDLDARKRIGLVVGLFDEEIALYNDTLFVDGFPESQPFENPKSIRGEVPLTDAGPASILVVTFSEGRLADIHRVALIDIVGRVYRLF